jgi:hypothetical protein
VITDQAAHLFVGDRDFLMKTLRLLDLHPKSYDNTDIMYQFRPTVASHLQIMLQLNVPGSIHSREAMLMQCGISGTLKPAVIRIN